MANKGEWSEPYAAVRILGEKKLFVADDNGERNNQEWMDVLRLIRYETVERENRTVSYQCVENSVNIEIFVNDLYHSSVAAECFLNIANMLAEEIKNGKGSSFTVSDTIIDFLQRVNIHSLKSKSVNKSDIFLSIRDPRASITRENVGFSIKSDFGKPPTLFNTAKASAVIYRVTNMTDELMEEINGLFDNKGHVAVMDRCERILANGCELIFEGYPMAERAGCKAFQENLDLIDPRLGQVIERILWNHFVNNENRLNISDVTQRLVEENPCNLSRPDVKYPYMLKSFLYAAYCGMTASTLWDGTNQVNGGFIKVSADGEVLVHYALESDAFKSYLYSHCFLDFPSTSEGHGHYAKVYKENGQYYFRLNFQIKYR